MLVDAPKYPKWLVVVGAAPNVQPIRTILNGGPDIDNPTPPE